MRSFEDRLIEVEAEIAKAEAKYESEGKKLRAAYIARDRARHKMAALNEKKRVMLQRANRLGHT